MAETDFWYSMKGADQDVVLSTRVRLARNLASFPFPQKFQSDDGERVKTLILDAFSQIEDPDTYQPITLNLLNETNRQILVERGLLDEKSTLSEMKAVVMRLDGKVSASINEIDHLRISSFVSGFEPEAAFHLAKEIDDDLQKTVQFAASYEFGFLTAEVKDSGSGMKVSCRLHLPSLSFLGRGKEFINEILEKDLMIDGCFGAGSEMASSLGSFYQVSTKLASAGSEADQIAVLVSAVRHLVEKERKARLECIENHQTRLYNDILRAFAISKFSTLVDIREGIELLSKLKWGSNLGLLEGFSDTDAYTLLYGIQKAHLQFLMRNSKFRLESDVEGDEELSLNRIRSLIIREAMENAKLVEK